MNFGNKAAPAESLSAGAVHHLVINNRIPAAGRCVVSAFALPAFCQTPD